MSQVVKRKITSQTRAGQYMCPESAKFLIPKKKLNATLK